MRGIAIAGRAGSGKSTLARALRTELGLLGRKAEVVSFATELKREVWERYGLKKGDVGSREALIEHGERRRVDDPVYWVKRALPAIELAQAEGRFVIVDDLRRLPEYEWLTEAGFYRLRVMAPEARRRKRLEDQGLDPDFAVSSDPTETDHESWRFDARFLNAQNRDLHHYAQHLAQRVALRSGGRYLIASQ